MENPAAQRRLLNILNHIAPEDLLSQGLEALKLSYCNGGSILEEERKKATFDPKQITWILDGSKKLTQVKEMMAQVIESDPVLYNPNESKYDLTRTEARERTMAKVKRVIEMWSAGTEAEGTKREVPRSGKKVKDDDRKLMTDAFWWVLSLYDRDWATRIGVHFGLFMPAIMGQGTDEQQDRYLPDIYSMRIIGCFAMTELGHGSYIRGFETTSTYDKNTQEFIIDSPTLTSTKFWIGMAGQTATHSVVFARLIIDGKDYGVHNFVVPLRSTADGIPLPGIEVGDCGSKMGRNGLDNGWIRFHGVRIPRDNMLMKWAKVSPDGVYTSPPKAQLIYGAVIGGRVGMIRDASDFTKVALTIAIRYSAVRRQFPDANDKGEEQILNYQSHQYKLMPILSACYAYHFTSTEMNRQFERMTQELDDQNLSSLPGVHATSAGLKALSTWWCNESIEKCRQCLGGHGYSSYSGLSSLLADFAVMCTWEGDNTVLCQQTAKYLFKCVKRSLKGQKLHGYERYLQDIQKTLSSSPFNGSKEDDFTNLENQMKILKRVAVQLISKVGRRYQKEIEISKGNKEIAWNECMYDMIESTRSHCDSYILQCFIDAVQSNHNQYDHSTIIILTKLATLHGLCTINSYHGHLVESGYLNSSQMEIVRSLIRKLCKQIRNESVALVDSFNLPDFVINSPLGRYDGDIYTHYMDTIKRAPNSTGRPSYWESLIKPLTNPDK